MILEILIAIALAAATVAAFFEEIFDWAKEMYELYAPKVDEAITVIRRIPGAIEQALFYIKDGIAWDSGKTKNKERELTNEEIDELVKDGVFSLEQGETLKENRRLRIGIIRDK